MTKSSHKILQLTGFDPRFEQAFPKEHQQMPDSPLSPTSPTSATSSASVWSQDEAEFDYKQEGSSENSRTSLGNSDLIGFLYEQNGSTKNSSTAIGQSIRLSNDEGERLTPSIYNVSERSSRTSREYHEPVTSRKGTVLAATLQSSRQVATPDLEQTEFRPPTFPSKTTTRSTEFLALPELLAQGYLRDRNGVERNASSAYKYPVQNAISSAFALKPLSTPLKSSLKGKSRDTRRLDELKVTTTPKKTSFILSAKDSLEWGICDASSRTESGTRKHQTTPVSPMFSMESDHLSLSPPLGRGESLSPTGKKRIWGSGKHPLRSPYPFSKTHDHAFARESSASAREEGKDEAVETIQSPSRSTSFTRRLSNTIKHLSPTSSVHKKTACIPPPSNKYASADEERKANGPTTQFPLQSGLMEGLGKGKEVVGKVKKSVVGVSKEEKRRESLKKRIVVVGITDQNPGMYGPLAR